MRDNSALDIAGCVNMGYALTALQLSVAAADARPTGGL
jgi:hypothetical protein